MVNKKLFFSFCIIFRSIFAPNLAFSSATLAEEKVVSICKMKLLTHHALREKILNEVLKFDGLHAILAQQVEIPGNACRLAVVDYLQQLQTQEKAAERFEGRFAFVSLGVVARLPEAVKVIEKEISSGGGNEWLSALAVLDEQAYLRTLRSFVWSSAAKVRQTQNCQISPLIVDRYVRALESKKINVVEGDYSALNAVFAGSNAAYRQVFLHPFKNLILSHSTPWIQAFRTESAWIQFRLLPVMKAVNGPEMVRELMWLSNHHPEQRIRLLAGRTLDEALDSPTLKN